MTGQTAIAHLLEMLGGIEEPLGVAFQDDKPVNGLTPVGGKHACIINYMRQARAKKQPVWFAADTPGCIGGWVYMGFILPPPERIAHFVTTGLPGEEGERYMPGPESMHRLFAALDLQPVPARFCLIKPLGMFEKEEKPLLIVFHCRAEALTGLCQLAYFTFDDHEAVTMPFGAGCSNMFAWPLHYQRTGLRKAVVGGVDPSCRPFMKVDELSFTITAEMLEAMAEAAPRSFLNGKTWSAVLKKIEKSKKAWNE